MRQRHAHKHNNMHVLMAFMYNGDTPWKMEGWWFSHVCVELRCSTGVNWQWPRRYIHQILRTNGATTTMWAETDRNEVSIQAKWLTRDEFDSSGGRWGWRRRRQHGMRFKWAKFQEYIYTCKLRCLGQFFYCRHQIHCGPFWVLLGNMADGNMGYTYTTYIYGIISLRITCI